MAYRYVTCTLTFQHCLCNCKTLPYNINICICTFNKVFPLQNKNTKKKLPKKPTNKQQHETNIIKRSVQRFEPAVSHPEAILPGHLEEFDQVHTLTQLCYHGNFLDVSASSRDTES